MAQLIAPSEQIEVQKEYTNTLAYHPQAWACTCVAHGVLYLGAVIECISGLQRAVRVAGTAEPAPVELHVLGTSKSAENIFMTVGATWVVCWPCNLESNGQHVFWLQVGALLAAAAFK